MNTHRTMLLQTAILTGQIPSALLSVVDAREKGKACFERTGANSGAGGYLRNVDSGERFHISGTDEHGNYIGPHGLDSTGKPIPPDGQSKRFAITRKEKLISMFDLKASEDGRDEYTRSGFQGRYKIFLESDGTYSLYFGGGSHTSELPVAPQTFHHGSWDLSMTKDPTGMIVPQPVPNDAREKVERQVVIPPKVEPPRQTPESEDIRAKAQAGLVPKEASAVAAILYDPDALTPTALLDRLGALTDHLRPDMKVLRFAAAPHVELCVAPEVNEKGSSYFNWSVERGLKEGVQLVNRGDTAQRFPIENWRMAIIPYVIDGKQVTLDFFDLCKEKPEAYSRTVAPMEEVLDALAIRQHFHSAPSVLKLLLLARAQASRRDVNGCFVRSPGDAQEFYLYVRKNGAELQFSLDTKQAIGDLQVVGDGWHSLSDWKAARITFTIKGEQTSYSIREFRDAHPEIYNRVLKPHESLLEQLAATKPTAR